MARSKAKKVLPRLLCHLRALEAIWGPPERVLREEDMRVYQTWMSEAIQELPGVLLGAEMGLGKTGATLHAIQKSLKAGTTSRWLIVAPLKVCEETWPEEIAKWTFARHLTYRVVTGSTEERRAALAAYPKTDLTIVNFHNLLWLLRYIRPERWPFDGIVYDEASRLKRGVLRSSPKANGKGEVPKPQLTNLGVLDRMRGRTRKIVELSGTPSPNGLIDLYGPMFAIDRGERLGSSKDAFQKRWFDFDAYTYSYDPKPNAEAEIMARLKDRFFSLREEDYLTLPELVEVDHYVRLPLDLQIKYAEFKREMALDVVNRWGEPEVVEAVNRGVLLGKLLQFANGSLYNSEREVIPLHTLKLDVLESIVEEAAGRPVLCAYSFQFDRDAIKKKFKFARQFGESASDKRDWDAGRIRLMLLHPASAGHGLNFQFGGNIEVWYGLTWSHELYWQFLKRLHRSGQLQDRVFLHRILTRQTADELIMPVLRDRKATEDRLKAAVKADLSRAVDGRERGARAA